ncbi:MAG: bifunctional UDP-sugar hydrolase/5'-nucleotidase [Novosphingobium sp.]
MPAPALPRFLATFALALALGGCATTSATRQAAPPVTVGIAAINDFHGNLEPPKQSAYLPDGKGELTPVPAGGAAWLASTIEAVRGKYSNHLTISAGDLIGSSPLTSSLFLDEPTIEVMNRIGLDFNAVGNHEFDSGLGELRRKQTGGCHQFTERKPCQLEPFRGAQFGFLAANVITKDGSTLFPATAMRSFGTGRGRVKIGLIGMTLKGTGALSPLAVSQEVRFMDEADTANALVGGLKKQGADAVILVIHQGGRTTGEPDPNGCENLNSEIRPILDRLDSRVDVVVSGHTHWSYICDYADYNKAKPFLLTSAGLWGEYVTDIVIEIDPVSHKVVAKHARNVVVQSPAYTSPRARVANTDAFPRHEPRADIAAYVARYVDAAKDFTLRKVGTLARAAEKNTGKEASSGGVLGNLIADAQLAATAGAGAQIACTNPFGIRRSLIPLDDGSVTFGDLYLVQPFNSQLETLSYTGAELKAVLEQGFDADGPEQVLACSAGFHFSYDRTRPAGDRIVAMSLNGARVDPAKSYRVTVNSFLANGGDTFYGFTAGRDMVLGVTDIVALEGWLKAVPPRDPPQEKRASDLHPETNPTNLRPPPGVKY